MIDLNLLNKANNGDIIATGLFDDSPQGYNWQGSGGLCRYVVKKGYGGDFAVYVGLLSWTENTIARQGDKVYNEKSLQRIFGVTEEALPLYRNFDARQP